MNRMGQTNKNTASSGKDMLKGSHSWMLFLLSISLSSKQSFLLAIGAIWMDPFLVWEKDQAFSIFNDRRREYIL